jgi:hypothetical protein
VVDKTPFDVFEAHHLAMLATLPIDVAYRGVVSDPQSPGLNGASAVEPAKLFQS